MAWITYYLPRKLLSRFVGLLVHLKLPLVLRWPLMAGFAKYYKIRLDEAEKSLSQYPSLGEFFVRGLKSHLRPLGSSWLLHCADSKITQIGEIHEGTAIQAKGRAYSVGKLCQNHDISKDFQSGLFMTYYLCPTDYHRVHSPVSGEVTYAKYIPGDLWPVNDWSTQNISELFCINERVVVKIETEWGALAAVLVGATNVGFIELAFDASLKGNQGRPAREKKYAPTVKLSKGEELGRFRMGSTVVLLLDEKLKQKILSESKSWKPEWLLGKNVTVRSNFVAG